MGARAASVRCRASCALALLALPALLARPAAALEPDAPFDETVHSDWPSVAHAASVYALAPARAGHIWIGTSEGLVRFDGRQMVTMDRWPGVGTARVTALFEAADGTTWVGTDRRGAARLRDDQVVVLPANPSVGVNVTAFAQSPDGTIWVAGANGVVRVPAGGTPVAAAEGLPSPAVHALAIDREGALWAGTQAGLARWDGRRWQTMAGPGGESGRIDALHVDTDGTLWVGTHSHGLWQSRGDDWRVYDREDGLDGDVSALLRDRAGHLWLGTRGGGLFVERGGRFARADWSSPCSGAIAALAEDAEGGLWVGGELCGLHRMADRAFRVLGKRDGLPGDNLLSLARASDGTVWVGVRGRGVVRLRDTRVVEPVACDDPYACQMCWDFSPAAGGAWVVCRGRTVMRATAQGLARVRSLPGGVDEATYVRETSDGALWLASAKRVFRTAGGTTTAITGQEPLEGHRLFVEGRGGVVWIVASDGVARWQSGHIELFRLPGTDGPAEVTTAYEDTDGALWMGTMGAGLRRLAGGRFATVSPAEGLPTGWIAQLLEDDRGRLWASSSKGIFWVDRRALAEVAEHRRARVVATLYDASDGVEMRLEAFGHPAGFKDERGRLWFATSGGIAIFDPAAPAGPPPRAVIDDVRLGGGAGLRSSAHSI